MWGMLLSVWVDAILMTMQRVGWKGKDYIVEI